MIRCLILLYITLAASHAAAADVAIMSREDWGARSPRADVSTYAEYDVERPAYDRIVLHVTSMGYGRGKAEARRIQNFQMDVRGFSDLAYNYLIDAGGAVYEGRSLDFVPAHAGRVREADDRHDITIDPDFGAIGIVFSADTDEPLTADQVSAAIALIRWLRTRHPIDTIITHTEVRDWIEARGLTPANHGFAPERCPGSGSMEAIVAIREALDPGFDEAAYRRRFRD